MTKYNVEISAKQNFVVEAVSEEEAQYIVSDNELNLIRLLDNLEYYTEEME